MNIYILFFKKLPQLRIHLFWLSLVLIAFPQTAFGQDTAADTTRSSEETVVENWPEDSLGRRAPRGAIRGFISAAGKQNYERAALYLNLDSAHYGSTEGARLAELLHRLLDQRGQLIPYSFISAETSGKLDDELRPDLERVGTIEDEDESFTIFVEKIIASDGSPVWLVSRETVDRISTMNIDTSVPLVGKFLPDVLEENTWGGVSIGEWLAMLILAAFAYLVSWSVTSLIILILGQFWKKAKVDPRAGIIKAFALPVKLYMSVWLFVIFSQEAEISVIARQKFTGITIIVGLIAFLLLLWRLTENISYFSQRRFTARKNLAGVSAVLFLKRFAKITIVVIGVIFALSTFGVDVTAGIAALGIGGIALALGAQKTVENFVGSVTLITDQPIRIGDFIRAGDITGTVEQIGMRSTRVRTNDRTLVTIPNGEFSSSKIENFAHRDKFLFHQVLGLRYETTPDQLRYLLVELRAILYAHPKIDPSPARVRFVGFGDSSLNLEIFAYVLGKDFSEFLEVREDIYLRVMDLVEESGTGFAFPSQTLYLAKDEDLPEEKIRKVIEKVKRWQEEGDLQIPGFDETRIEELKNTIPYPPEGSVRNKQ